MQMPDGSHGELITRAFSTLTLKAIDEEQRIIEGIASTPNSDRKGDVVWPKGAKFKLPLPFLMQHAATPNESVGHVIEAHVTDAGIRIKARIERDPLLPELDRAWARIKKGLVRGLSIGFKSLESELVDRKDPYGARIFKSWEWVELSAVVIPANEDATIFAIKSAYAQSQAVPGRSATAVRTFTPAGAAARQGTSMEPLHTQLAGLQDIRRQKAARMEELLGTATTDKRDMSEDERVEFDEHSAEIKRLDPQITLKTIQLGQAA